MRNPPLYTLHDLETWVTLPTVMDAHEIMKLEGASAEKHRLDAEMRNRS